MNAIAESLERELKEVQLQIEKSENRLDTLSSKPEVVVELDLLEKLETKLKTLREELN